MGEIAGHLVDQVSAVDPHLEEDPVGIEAAPAAAEDINFKQASLQNDNLWIPAFAAGTKEVK